MPQNRNVATAVIGGKVINPYTPLSNSSSYLIGGTPKPITTPTPTYGPVQPPKLNTTSKIPSTALTKPTTPTDVASYRNKLQTALDSALKLKEMLQNTSSPTFTAGTVPNPEVAVMKFLNGEAPVQTEAQKQEQGYLGSIRDKTKEFFSGREKMITDTYNKYGVPSLEKPLAETRKAIAERQVQLRERLRALEFNSNERGITREGAVDLRNKVNSDAYNDLANLALIETAQLGNLTQAKNDAKAAIDEQYASYEAYIQQQQAELDYLKPTLTADQKRQADIVQFQLDQYKEQLDTKKEEAASVKDLAIEIAGQGAPTKVVQSILSDPTMTYDRAIQIATPYIGLLDRRNTESLIADRASSSASDTSYIKLSPEDKKTLAGKGFTQSEINDIPKVVSEFGIQALIDEYKNDPAKLKAITTIYNDPSKKESQFTREYVAQLYGITDSAKKSSFLGFEYGTTGKEQLDAIMKTVEMYQKLGYSDKEIYDKIKG